jgi:methionyl-tRNA formyltransferase
MRHPLVCLNDDLMSNLALNLLWPALLGHEFEIILSRGIGGKNAVKAPQIERWQQLERELVADGLYPLLKTRDAVGQFQSFDQLAGASSSKALRVFANINREDGLAYVRQLQPDLLVSIRFGQIFRPSVIAIPRFGILNLHSGLLPDYRGILATFWAMLEGRATVGCTLHHIADGSIDTGPIIATHAVPVNRQRSLLWNIASLYPGGTGLIADTLEKFATGRQIEVHPQGHQGPLF